MQADSDPPHETQQPADGQGEPSARSVRQPIVEKCCRKHPKRGYFKNPKNWVSLLTLLFVATYTVITVFIWLTQRDTERRQLRAYVGVSPAGVIDFGDREKQAFQVTVKNYGATPAYHMTPLHQHLIIQTPKSQLRFLPSECRVIKGNPVLFPMQSNITFDYNGAVDDDGKPLPSDQIDRVRSNKTMKNATPQSRDEWFLFYYGRLCYEDAFGTVRYTDWCFIAAGDDMSAKNIGTCRAHNSSN